MRFYVVMSLVMIVIAIMGNGIGISQHTCIMTMAGAGVLAVLAGAEWLAESIKDLAKAIRDNKK